MILELQNICFNVNEKKILDKINIKINLNELYVITGPNGSGKSTLMKIISGLEKPSSGKIFYNNEDITEYSIDKRANLGISFAFQQPIKFKGLRVIDILKIASKNKDKEVICEILKSVGLSPEEYLYREMDSSLSGGEHKRIELATVLLRDTKLNIFDEPEAGIDLWSFNELTDLFKSLKKTEKTTIIISHQEKILKISDNVILLKNGKINKIGSYNEVVENG